MTARVFVIPWVAYAPEKLEQLTGVLTEHGYDDVVVLQSDHHRFEIVKPAGDMPEAKYYQRLDGIITKKMKPSGTLLTPA